MKAFLLEIGRASPTVSFWWKIDLITNGCRMNEKKSKKGARREKVDDEVITNEAQVR